MLYVRLNKALHGCLRVTLLSYQKLRKELTDYDFLINNHDPCVANKLAEGSQMAVTYHVDNLKISQNNPNQVTNLLTHIEKIYSEKFPVYLRKKHTYLGMNLDFSILGVVKVLMESYVMKIMEEFQKEFLDIILTLSKTCAANHLLTVNPDGKKLTNFVWSYFIDMRKNYFS